ncbi:hypothetical protein KUV65_15030 [Maritalea mobilis]|uniref:Stf0 family sulfotransferase n=1 Tax=Maritalea mobilis TaxID=483324 RepID=UPI001C9489FA|nr:Stf0 family sulfotransferase [Maritalea mobilis]MBY6202688.1 hypothetical protein [Maritalea mobilis]
MEDVIDEYFTRSSENPDRRAKLEAKPLPRRRLVIYFTPRSGSSWLTDLIAQSRRLGAGNELFNPNFVPNIANGIQALGREDYIMQAQKRFSSPNGVFSFEITAHQLDRLFPDSDTFMTHFNQPDCRAMWLIRKDIVAQAVSLAKMVCTKVAHTPHATPEDRARAETAFPYDAENIERWLKHILNAERRSEYLFDLYGIEPYRFCYEDMMEAGSERTRSLLATVARVRDADWPDLELKHAKLGTPQNAEYAERFRAERAAFLKDVDDERRYMLDQLQDI